jgi:hypothetical protein
LLRRDLAPRQAFHYLHKLIGTVWHSRASGQTDAEGLFQFRGFFGDYRAAARLGEEAATTALIPAHPGHHLTFQPGSARKYASDSSRLTTSAKRAWTSNRVHSCATSERSCTASRTMIGRR